MHHVWALKQPSASLVTHIVPLYALLYLYTYVMRCPGLTRHPPGHEDPEAGSQSEPQIYGEVLALLVLRGYHLGNGSTAKQLHTQPTSLLH